VQQLCAYDKDAAVYYDACYLRFSNQNFIASTTNNGDPIILMNSQNVSSPVRAFDAAVAVLLNATGDYAAANSSRFGTGKRVSTQATPPSTGHAVHAGHVVRRLPELPWEHNLGDAAVSQRKAGREDYRDAVQFQERGVFFLLRRPRYVCQRRHLLRHLT
jgi:hypothetical protein